MNFTTKIFREYDIRGLTEKELSAEFAYRLGCAYMALAKERVGKDKLKISVGHDCRVTGRAYSRALMAGLQDSGADVLDLSLVTTPMEYFSIFHLKLDGGIMVTGSHNPPNYNGFKICVGKGTLYGQDIQELRALIEKDLHKSVSNDYDRPYRGYDIFPEYEKFFQNDIKINRKLRVVVDAGNGAAGPFSPGIFEKLGCEVISIFCEPDGRFPNHEADPTVEKNMQDLIRKVKETKADIGIAFDGDADRIGAVDENGKILWGDEIMVLFSRAVLEKNPGATIISEVKSSHRLYNDIKSHGGNGIMWKTGHSLIKAKMKETKALLAGEMSGHIFFADRFFGFDDATYAGARLLEILGNSSGPMSSLLKDLPKTVNTPEIRLDCDDDTKWAVIDRLKEKLRHKYTVNEIDGVRVEFGDSWGLVRASNTQPVIVMRFEAQSDSRLKEIRSIIETEARSAGLKI
jgi:phosphomannomutase/phosphoglucomutase